MVMPPSNQPTNSNERAPPLDHKKNEVMDAVCVQVIDSNEPEHDEIYEIINIIPLSRTFIGESHLSTPDL